MDKILKTMIINREILYKSLKKKKKSTKIIDDNQWLAMNVQRWNNSVSIN